MGKHDRYAKSAAHWVSSQVVPRTVMDENQREWVPWQMLLQSCTPFPPKRQVARVYIPCSQHDSHVSYNMLP